MKGEEESDGRRLGGGETGVCKESLTCRPSLAAAYESSGRVRGRKKRILIVICDTLKHSPHLHYWMTVDLDNFVVLL